VSERGWAAAHGYARCVHWPAGDGLLDEPPLPGADRDVLVHAPFIHAPGEPFWTLFMPALAEVNGWDEGERGLEALCLARCALTQVPRAQPARPHHSAESLASARALEVYSLRDWALALPASSDGQFTLPYKRSERIDRGDLTLLAANIEGDAGLNWLFVRTEPCWTLILEHDWAFSYRDEMRAGRRLLSAEEHETCRQIG
jgi:hypothetical protein